MHHFRDPCIHCGIGHDDVPPGPCLGDPKKAVVVAYCVDRQAWQNPGSGADTVLCAMSDGSILTEARHPAEHWPWLGRFKDARTMARHEFRHTYRQQMA